MTERMFLATLPGLAPLAEREIADLDGVRSTGSGNDSRSDVVLLDAEPSAVQGLLQLRTAEDVFVEVGRTLRSEGDRPQWIARRLWRAGKATRALSTWARTTRRNPHRTTYRVVVRVLQEQSFQRTELRRALTKAIGKESPQWTVADPAALELWAVEYARGRFVLGARLSDVQMRQRGGRDVERSGALRPAVAGAMVRLAGTVDGALVDPCCGSGTLLSEAFAVGWSDVRGIDIDDEAVAVARRNARRAQIEVGDALRMPYDDGAVSTVVSNLPFGKQYGVRGDMTDWLTNLFAEISRVVRPGGTVVLLAPSLPRVTLGADLRLREQHRIRLLGTRTSIWVVDRRA